VSLVTKATSIALIGIALYTHCFPAKAHLGVAVSSGQGVRDITPLRLAFLWDIGSIWYKEALGSFDMLLESSAGFWNGSSRSEYHANRTRCLQVLTIGPVLRWQRWKPFDLVEIFPYAELGVGLSWLSKTEIQGRILSLHFQFEDKIGIGVRFGKQYQYDLAVRAYHYSNASIQRPNSGVNLVMASFGVWFSKW
jgi:lipid A 3-O-deacylase